MRIVVAMDSFKGSLTSEEAGNAVKAGVLKADPSARCCEVYGPVNHRDAGP